MGVPLNIYKCMKIGLILLLLAVYFVTAISHSESFIKMTDFLRIMIYAVGGTVIVGIA